MVKAVEKTYADRLLWLREVAKIGAREVARLAGSCESHTSRLEQAAPAAVSARSLYQIGQVFGVRLDWLYAGVGDPPTRASVIRAVRNARAKYEVRQSRESRV